MADEHNAEWYENTFKRMIYWVGGVLIAGTAITYVIDKWGVAEKYGLLTAVIFGLTVATIKAATVIVIFMHLKWDWPSALLYHTVQYAHRRVTSGVP